MSLIKEGRSRNSNKMFVKRCVPQALWSVTPYQSVSQPGSVTMLTLSRWHEVG